jgi:transposase
MRVLKIATKRNGRLFNGGTTPKVKWSGRRVNEPPIGAIKPVRQIEDEGVGLSSKGGAMLEVKVEKCAGIDVGKKFLAVCVLIGLANRKPVGEVRRFGTSVKELERLRAWLLESGCTEAVMESTGSYWKPVFNILEGSLKIILANPEQVKALRGKKTDVFGVSGQAMLEALLENKRSATGIAELAHWRLAPKIPRIIEALEGHRMRDPHRLLIRQSLDHMQYIEKMISELDAAIAERLRPYQKQIELACTVPGIGPTAAASILAETGMDMSPEGPFPDCHHLASWSAICPGNNESAGVRKSGRTRRGNRWLRATMQQTAWAGVAKKNSSFQLRYQKLKSRRGPQRAVTAVAPAQRIAIYWTLRNGIPYQEQIRHSEEDRRKGQIRHHLRQLTKLGHQIEGI